MRRLTRILLLTLITYGLVVGVGRHIAGAKNQANGQTVANSPVGLPKSSWKVAFRRTKEALKNKDLASSAAALAYYAILTFFPAILGLATAYVALTNATHLQSIVNGLQHALPSAMYEVIDKQLLPLMNSNRRSASAAAVISVAAVLWTTSGGLQSLVRATNKAYEVQESRSFIKLRLISLALSILLLACSGIILMLLLMQGSALTALGFTPGISRLFPLLRWPLLVVVSSILLSAIYRYAPNRPDPRWQWVSWGATAATIIWLISTVLFFIYVQHFGRYTKTYGEFAAIVVLMIWFNISAFIVVLGAQVNKKLEEVSSIPA